MLNYQGNWRDIFQNWEALASPSPNSIESMIAKFVNASTMDGFNPYRVTRDGIDWEVPDPHDPWRNIGYWGDHQIIYLLKFLEASHRYHPGRVERCCTRASSATPTCPIASSRTRRSGKTPADTIVFDARPMQAIETHACGNREPTASSSTARTETVSCTSSWPRSCSSTALARLSQPGPGRRHLDEHAAAGMERRQQRPGRRRHLDGHAAAIFGGTSRFIY